MPAVKPWYSKTIWINAIMGILAALAAFVPALSGWAAWIQANATVIGMVWAGFGIALRLITKGAISLVD